MNHNYEFVDRSGTERFWLLSWHTVMRRHPDAAWVRSPGSESNQSEGNVDTMAQLLAFGIDPMPSSKQINRILSIDTVGGTVRRCRPQFFAMSEIMRWALPTPERLIFTVEVKDAFGVIAVALNAFLTKRISGPTLWSVVKLHSVVDLASLQLSRDQIKTITTALPWHRMWEPIYKWQGKNAFKNDEWTNCLRVADTRRFASFLAEAYRENWEESSIRQSNGESVKRFRDNPSSVILAKSLRRLNKLERPYVARTWE
jgi:hypothetical protein